MRIDLPSFPRGISSEPFSVYSSLMFLGTGLTQESKCSNPSEGAVFINMFESNKNTLFVTIFPATADVTDHSPAAVKE